MCARDGRPGVIAMTGHDVIGVILVIVGFGALGFKLWWYAWRDKD
jgi:hypothetical protein